MEAVSRASPLVSVPVPDSAASRENPQPLTASSRTVSTARASSTRRRDASRRVSAAMVRTVLVVVTARPPSRRPQDAEQALLQADPCGLDGVHPGAEADQVVHQGGDGRPVVVGRQRHREPVAGPLDGRRSPRAAPRPHGDTSVRCSRTSRWPSSSASVPDAATRPRSRMTTRSQTRSTSPIRWEFNSTATPRDRSASTMSRTSTRPSGSSALVGSSRTTRSGPVTSATASPRRCCMPLEKPPTRSPARSARPDEGQALALLPLRARRSRTGGRGGSPPRRRSATAGSGTARAGSRRGRGRPGRRPVARGASPRRRRAGPGRAAS